MSYTFSSAEQAQIQAAISASTGLSWDGNRYLGVPGAGTGIGVRSCLLLPAITELNRSLPITPAPRLGCKAPLSRRDQPADAQYRQASQTGYGDAAPPVGPIEACRLAKGKT